MLLIVRLIINIFFLDLISFAPDPTKATEPGRLLRSQSSKERVSIFVLLNTMLSEICQK